MSGRTRRRLLGVAVVALALAGCGGSSSAKKASGWTFTDDRGVTVSLKSRPKRIVAYDIAASALMHIGLKPVGIFASFPFEKNPQLAGLDLSGIAKVSEAYGQINLETLAATRPDLIVTIFNPLLTGPVIGFPDKATQAKAQKIAPIVAINSTKDVTTVIDRFEQLGKALGLNLDAPDVKAAHKRFEEASARLRKATAAKPRLKALAMAGVKGLGFSFARPDLNPTLRLYEKLGLHVIKPVSKPGNINKDYNSYFYERASFELADKYPADLILWGHVPGTLDLAALNRIPTWQQLPAVKAGQLVSWRVLDPFSYELLSGDLERLAKAVENAKIVT